MSARVWLQVSVLWLRDFLTDHLLYTVCLWPGDACGVSPRLRHAEAMLRIYCVATLCSIVLVKFC